ncbi:MAG: GPP34 family phosphoprotein [Myxococcota bacterium]
MKLTLPETLLLFGLHDDKGTVHSAAYLALDPGLRGATVVELKLRGIVQVRTLDPGPDGRVGGEVRWTPDPPPPPRLPFLLAAMEALRKAPSPADVSTWLAALAIEMPDLRAQVLASLEARGVLGAPADDGPLPAVPVYDSTVEAALVQQVGWALEEADRISPRLGSLVGLTVACHLGGVVFGDQADAADERAAWVSERDAVLRAVVQSIGETEGW